MLGWYLDDLVVYLVRAVILFFRERLADAWSIAEADVVEARPPIGVSFPDATVVYAYKFEGEFYSGRSTRPFLLPRSAKAYAERFAKGQKVMIRVKPGDVERSMMRAEDQPVLSTAASAAK